MKKIYYNMLVPLCFVGTVAAQEKTDSLSLKSYTIGEVVVTGTRNETDVRHLSQTVSVIDRKAIEKTLQPSLLPVLTEQVPGLFTTARGIMGYGVSGGAAGGISLRGLSGGAGRMMVLIDGHPQYMGLMGHPIADAYQTASPIVNSALFGMPAVASLPAILLKSGLLAAAAGYAALRFKKATLGLLLAVVLAYQIVGTLGEWAMKGDFGLAAQDFRIGVPGMLLQIFGGWLFINHIIRK